ncbi:LemA family protein [Nafulsella turpanensis]|uniref:LemA family protein n=1 Tax=Nafulsella turpanensis TaxID=1265690 RepID=UPI00034B669F|nr:LemA family protein [Nafulsella turpanensis]
MKKTLRILLITALSASAYTACQRASEEKQAEEELILIDSLQQTFISLNDSAANRWEVILQAEEQKLAQMRAILEELSAPPVFNKSRLESLNKNFKEVYEMRLQEAEDLSHEQIDRYDSASQALKEQIIAYTEDHPDIKKFPLVTELIDSIQATDQQILFHRVRYDNFASDLNHFLEGNREYLPKIDTSGLAQERTLFQLPE